MSIQMETLHLWKRVAIKEIRKGSRDLSMAALWKSLSCLKLIFIGKCFFFFIRKFTVFISIILFDLVFRTANEIHFSVFFFFLAIVTIIYSIVFYILFFNTMLFNSLLISVYVSEYNPYHISFTKNNLTYHVLIFI